MDSIKTQLESLAENDQGKVNYVSWRFKLDLTLKSKGLFEIANGIVAKPEGSETDKSVKDWAKKDLEAQIFVGLNVSSEIAKKIANCNSAYKMLTKLETLYGKKSDLTVEGLQRLFFGYKYNGNKSAVENCLTIMQYAEDLEAEGETVKENWIMNRILGMLPPKLHHFRTAWDNVSPSDKNLNKLIERLRLEEDKLNETEKSKGQNALINKQTGKKPGKSNSQEKSTGCFKCDMSGHMKKDCKGKPCAKYLEYCKNTYPCNSCNQKGHFAKECPKGNNSRSTNDKSDKTESGKSNRRALITIGLSTAAIDDINSKANNDATWYQDCGATQHMTFRREWLSDVVELDEPVEILVGKVNVIKGVAQGDIELEAFNGKTWNKVTIKDVLYVPKLTFNLFSLTQALDRGYEQRATSNMTVYTSLDDNETVAIGERDGNLFRMLFRMENNISCLATTSIKQWHENLVHQNVKYARNILK